MSFTTNDVKINSPELPVGDAAGTGKGLAGKDMEKRKCLIAGSSASTSSISEYEMECDGFVSA